MAYRDEKSRITVYVESDGRHVAAISATGKLLWVRNPFADNSLCPYRYAYPHIAWIGPANGNFGWGAPVTPKSDANVQADVLKTLGDELAYKKIVPSLKGRARFIGLTFNSTQFGYLNLANGDFYDQGQN